MKLVKSFNRYWGFIQNSIGLLLSKIIAKDTRQFKFINVCIISDKFLGGFSLGNYVFVCESTINSSNLDNFMVRHEIGHSIQSAMLGPFYLIILGLSMFSFFKNYIKKKFNKDHISSHDKNWFERWADKLGGNINE